MKILGYYDGHNAAAALIENGKVIFAIEEERLSRIKFHDGRKPNHGLAYRCVEEVLKKTNTSPHQIDKIAIALELPSELFKKVCKDTFNEKNIRWIIPFFAGGFIIPPAYNYYRRHNINMVLKMFNLDKISRLYMNHHLAHIASAYYTGNKKNATIISLDGKGDELAGLAMVCEKGEFKEISNVIMYDSPGHFYSAATTMLGFKHNRHEGKITGLASFADWNNSAYDYFKKIFVNKPCNFKYNLTRQRFNFPYPAWGNFKSYAKMMEKGILNYSKLSKAQIASAVQKRLEETTTKFISDCVKKTGIKDVVTSGGVFANVKLNQRVLETENVESFYVHPAMGDGGLAVGAALFCYGEELKNQGKVFRPFEYDDVYLGTDYSDNEIQKALDDAKLKYILTNDIEGETAQMINENLVVGRFNGRMEYGPRALGNRSMLISPKNKSINDSVNKRLSRTEFMPFAPSTMEEHSSEIYKKYNFAKYPAKFMTITFNVHKEYIEKIPAVVHVDNTARPQCVTKQQNKSYYNILKAYKDLSGLPTFVNTSFNAHEEPIVCSPQHAIKSLKDGRIDALSIGNFLVYPKK
jgi:carbamoyltransferase